jgi:ubiquinone/menaquinone biosynthesis C-methylase UbiE
MKQLDEWTKYAAKFLTPGRRPHFVPASEILDIHQQKLDVAKKHNCTQLNALILGATPELADLALTNNCRVLRVDCNPIMFEAGKFRQKIEDRSNELIVVGDWLDLHMIGDGEIDLVLGDLSLNNIPHALMLQFLDEMARITHSGSLISIKQIIFPDEKVDSYEFHNAVNTYRGGEINDDEFYRILRFYSFISEAYDPITYMLDAEKVFNAIQKKYAMDQLTDAEYEFLYSRHNAIQHTIYTQTEQIRLLKRLGDCQIVQPGNDLFKVCVILR